MVCGREKVGVVDAGDASLGGVEGAGLSGAVDADAGAGAVGFRDGGGELGFVVLVGRREDRSSDKVVAAGLVDLGEVGALLALLAHGGDDLIGGVGAVGVGEQVLGGVEAEVVFVAAVDVDGVAGHAHARTGDEAGINCVADGDVGAPGPLGTHVALGGEAGDEVGFGGGGGEEGALGYGLEDGLEGFVAGVEEEVDVGVDETGHQGGGAEVDDLGACGVGDVLADLGDAVAGDEDFAGRDDFAGGDVEDASRLQNGCRQRGLLYRPLSSDKQGKEHGRDGKNKKSHLDCEDKALEPIQGQDLHFVSRGSLRETLLSSPRRHSLLTWMIGPCTYWAPAIRS